MKSYAQFWPYYLAQHRNATCRRLHFIGTTLALSCAAAALVLHQPLLWLGSPIAGYGFAWIGHAFFEKNRPATFRHPWWSLRADFEMYLKMLLGRTL
ncbi:MAG: DUF962 domain-containing protein [Deltaproteobacteria bacterium]|nr:DUF962 domain-containing protein [Deltaproteobacteria bacterium]